MSVSNRPPVPPSSPQPSPHQRPAAASELIAGVGKTVYEFHGAPQEASHSKTMIAGADFQIPIEERPHQSNLKSGGSMTWMLAGGGLAVVLGLVWAITAMGGPAHESTPANVAPAAIAPGTAAVTNPNVAPQVAPAGTANPTASTTNTNTAAPSSTKETTPVEKPQQDAKPAEPAATKPAKPQGTKVKPKKTQDPIPSTGGLKPKKPAKTGGGLDELPDPG